MSATDHRGAPRPGGRSARVRAAVHTAVIDLVGDGCVDEMTIPAIAARAEVNPTSLYRRWGDLETLLVEVAVSALTEDEPVPDTGSLRKDLLVWAEFLVTDIARPERVAFLRTLVGSMRDDEGKGQCMAKRAQQIQTILHRATDRGETAPTLEETMDRLVAPLYFRVLFGYGVTTKAYARELVTALVG